MSVNVCGVPVHPASEGVTVIFAVPAAVVVNGVIVPFPELANPRFALSFVHAKIAPFVPEKLITFVNCPAHAV